LIDNNNLHEIKLYAKKSYPNECCGFLLGTNTSEKKVVKVCPVKNTNMDRTHDRFSIDGRDFAKIDREAAKKGLQIIGIYHSHPDHPAAPSAFDTENAWVGYSYVIAAVEKGEVVDIKSWVFDEKAKQFEQETVSSVRESGEYTQGVRV